jgi:hypothetical protein
MMPLGNFWQDLNPNTLASSSTNYKMGQYSSLLLQEQYRLHSCKVHQYSHATQLLWKEFRIICTKWRIQTFRTTLIAIWAKSLLHCCKIKNTRKRNQKFKFLHRKVPTTRHIKCHLWGSTVETLGQKKEMIAYFRTRPSAQQIRYILIILKSYKTPTVATKTRVIMLR